MDRIALSDDDGQSIVSDLTSLEDTDEFGRKLLQHTRDAQRINNVLNHSPQAFRKARPLPRIALTLDNLQRNSVAINDGSARDGVLAQRAPSLASSTLSDPPLNVPQQWGRKGRSNTSWLKRVHQDGQHQTDEHQPQQQTVRQEGNTVYPHETLSASDHGSPRVDWAAAASQSVEVDEHQSSPLLRRPTPHSSATQKISPGRIDDWEIDQDLTAASLLASTPALPSRSRQAIDDIRQREIDSIGKRAVTSTRRQSWEQTSPETRRRPSAKESPHTAEQRPLDSSTETRPAVLSTHTTSAHRRSSILADKENVPLSAVRQDGPTPRVLSKSIESIGHVDQAIQATVTRSPKRPQHQKRTDSMALLKRLARVSSPTSGPTPPKQLPETDRKPDAQRNPSEPEQTGLGAAAASLDTALRKEPPDTSTSGNRDHLHAQTPVVTGAWIDTPGPRYPTHSQSSSDLVLQPAGYISSNDHMPATSPSASGAMHQRRRSEPKLPTSALDAILEDMRNRDQLLTDDPTLGDSTIASLENMVHPAGHDPTVTLNIPDSILDDTSHIDIRPITQAERDTRQEELALEALNSRLDSTRTSIENVSKSLQDAERQVHTVAPRSSTRARPKAEHVCDGHCDSCGRHTSIFKSAWNELLGLYCRRDSRAVWGMRLTWLGLACVVFWSWLATETTLWYVLTRSLLQNLSKLIIDPARCIVTLNTRVICAVTVSIRTHPVSPTLFPPCCFVRSGLYGSLS